VAGAVTDEIHADTSMWQACGRKVCVLVRRISVFLAASLWIAGTVLWLTVRDRYPVFAPLSYGLPLPVLVACGLWCLLFLQNVRKRVRIGWIVCVLVQAGFWLSSSFVMRAGVAPRAAGTLMFWNVCRGYGGYAEAGAEIRRFDVDVVALVEATGDGQDVTLWQRVCPGYHVTRLGSGMILMLRGEKLRRESGVVPGVCRYRVLDLLVHEQPLTLIILDVNSDPRKSRQPAFDRLEELITKYADRPLIIAGDFNTPLESIHVGRMRQCMLNAFEVSGHGLRDTWPVLLPVLSLDQVWGNAHVHWHRCEHGWSCRSDHRPVLATFSTRLSSSRGQWP
ncbi:MAG: endonuclease/exonuclease/phosphatase family protein, partial [Planctomycetaceae bacterium]